MKGTKTEENNANKANRKDTRAREKESEKIHGKSVNNANKANMTNRRDTRTKEQVSEKIHEKSGKKRENEERERTMTFLK